MANGAANAAHRRDAEYAEYGTAIGIAISSLSEEARELAFTKSGSAEVQRSFGSKHPSVMRIDVDGDHKPDTTLRFDYTFWGTVDKIDVDGKCISHIGKNLGRVQSVPIDLNDDKSPDVTITVDRTLLEVNKINIDTTGDGKPDIILTPDNNWVLHQARGMHVDLNADGKPDAYMKFKRNWWGNIDAVELSPKTTSP